MESSSSTNKICISVDGSNYSAMAFDIALNELYKKENEIHLINISNPKAKDLPFNMQPESIRSNFQGKLVTKLPKSKYFVQFQNKQIQDRHSLERVYEIATSLQSDVLVVGFQSKPNKLKNEITSGIRFIIENINIPTFIIKEYIPREKTKSLGYIWLACIDTSESLAFNALTKALKYMDAEKDQIVCLHVGSDNGIIEQIENNFAKFTKENRLKDSKVIILREIKESRADSICEYVNFTPDTPNFVILGHNKSKYLYNKYLKSPCEGIIRHAWTNIFFQS